MGVELDQLERVIIDYVDSDTFRTELRPNSREASRNDLARFLSYIASLPEGTEVNSSVLNGFIARHREMGTSEKTLARRSSSIRNTLDHLRRTGLIDEDITVGLDPISYSRKLVFNTPLTVDEEQKLFQEVKDKPRHSALFATLIGTGGKVSEVLGLNTQDVVREDSSARVTFTKSVRCVVITGDNAQRLLNYSELWESGRPIFTTAKGEARHSEEDRLSHENMWFILKERRGTIGRSNLCPTVLRATYVDRLRLQGTKQVADALGINRNNARYWLRAVV